MSTRTQALLLSKKSAAGGFWTRLLATRARVWVKRFGYLWNVLLSTNDATIISFLYGKHHERFILIKTLRRSSNDCLLFSSYEKNINGEIATRDLCFFPLLREKMRKHPPPSPSRSARDRLSWYMGSQHSFCGFLNTVRRTLWRLTGMRSKYQYYAINTLQCQQHTIRPVHRKCDGRFPGSCSPVDSSNTTWLINDTTFVHHHHMNREHWHDLPRT